MSGNFVGFFCSGHNLRANPSTVTVQSAIFENSIDFESHKFANDNFQMNATVIIKLSNEWNGAACAHPKMHENQIFELLKLDAFDAMGFAKCDRQPDREVCHGINNMGKPNIRTTNASKPRHNNNRHATEAGAAVESGSEYHCRLLHIFTVNWFLRIINNASIFLSFALQSNDIRQWQFDWMTLSYMVSRLAAQGNDWQSMNSKSIQFWMSSVRGIGLEILLMLGNGTQPLIPQMTTKIRCTFGRWAALRR